jgi:hypothetical protein
VHRHERLGAFGGLKKRVIESASLRGVRGLQRAHHPQAAHGRQVATFIAGKERLGVEGKRPVAHAGGADQRGVVGRGSECDVVVALPQVVAQRDERPDVAADAMCEQSDPHVQTLQPPFSVVAHRTGQTL